MGNGDGRGKGHRPLNPGRGKFPLHPRHVRDEPAPAKRATD